MLLKYQNKNLAAIVYKKFFIKYLLGRYFPFYLCARTQNPAVYKSLSRFSTECYPKINDNTKSNEITQLCKSITKYLWTDKFFDAENMVIKDVWGFSIYNSLPYKDNKISDFYKNHVSFNANKGDTLFILSYINTLSRKFWLQLLKK